MSCSSSASTSHAGAPLRRAGREGRGRGAVEQRSRPRTASSGVRRRCSDGRVGMTRRGSDRSRRPGGRAAASCRPRASRRVAARRQERDEPPARGQRRQHVRGAIAAARLSISASASGEPARRALAPRKAVEPDAGSTRPARIDEGDVSATISMFGPTATGSAAARASRGRSPSRGPGPRAGVGNQRSSGPRPAAGASAPGKRRRSRHAPAARGEDVGVAPASRCRSERTPQHKFSACSSPSSSMAGVVGQRRSSAPHHVAQAAGDLHVARAGRSCREGAVTLGVGAAAPR